MTEFIPATMAPESIAGLPPYVIIGRVARLLAEAGNDQATISRFQTEATSGDYETVIATALAWTTAPEEF